MVQGKGGTEGYSCGLAMAAPTPLSLYGEPGAVAPLKPLAHVYMSVTMRVN